MSAFITHSQYWAGVVNLMHSVIREVNPHVSTENPFDYDDWMQAEEICMELTDTHVWVQYTDKSQCVMMHSDNANALFEKKDAASFTSASEFFTHAASYALHADVWSMLCRYMATLEAA